MINIFMPVNYAYPFAPYVQDQPLFLKFFVSTYSVKNTERTRNSVQNRAAYTITLPLPSDVGYAAAHEFGQGWTPIAPITGFTPNILNNGGKMKNGEIDTSNYDAGREYSSVSFIQELQNLQSSTFKKFILIN